MREDLQRYLDGLFESAPKTKKVLELKEELLINMDEKFNDLISNGYSEEDAYKTVISGIGDVDELISNVQPDPFDPVSKNIQRKKNAMVVSVCVGLYILGLLLSIFLDTVTANGDLSAIAFLGISAVSTCILIYHFLSRPKYVREEDTIVEDFKEWKSNDNRKRSLTGAISAVLWTVIVSFYFIISFMFNNWHVSWIIFLVGFAINQIIYLIADLFMDARSKTDKSQYNKKLLNSVISLIWTVTIAAYFIISFTFWNWHVSWIIFLVAAVATSLANLLFRLKK